MLSNNLLPFNEATYLMGAKSWIDTYYTKWHCFVVSGCLLLHMRVREREREREACNERKTFDINNKRVKMLSNNNKRAKMLSKIKELKKWVPTISFFNSF